MPLHRPLLVKNAVGSMMGIVNTVVVENGGGGTWWRQYSDSGVD